MQPSSSGWSQVGDGSFHTTPSELVRWADNYRTGAVGGDRLLEATTSGAVPIGPGYGKYGAGIEIAEDGALSHLGGWSGFVTAFGITGDRETAIAVSCNSDAADLGTIAEGLRIIWAS